MKSFRGITNTVKVMYICYIYIKKEKRKRSIQLISDNPLSTAKSVSCKLLYDSPCCP